MIGNVLCCRAVSRIVGECQPIYLVGVLQSCPGAVQPTLRETEIFSHMCTLSRGIFSHFYSKFTAIGESEFVPGCIDLEVRTLELHAQTVAPNQWARLMLSLCIQSQNFRLLSTGPISSTSRIRQNETSGGQFPTS